ncbi:MAG: hypothetical protein RL417_2159 [Pseudomonadota bacterium]
MDREKIKERLTHVVDDVLDRSTSLADPAVVQLSKELGVELETLSIRSAERVFRGALEELYRRIDASLGCRSSRRAAREARGMADRLEIAGFTPEEKQRFFVERHDIVVGVHKVRVSLGDTTPLEFLGRANEIAVERFGSPAVNPHLLGYWERWWPPVVEGSQSSGVSLAVNGAPSQTSLRLGEDERNGGSAPLSVRELAVAFAAFKAATGDDIFNGAAIRATDGSLVYAGPNGLENRGDLQSGARLGDAPARECQVTRPIGRALRLQQLVVRPEPLPDTSASEPQSFR